jgi:hypothetical protein
MHNTYIASLTELRLSFNSKCGSRTCKEELSDPTFTKKEKEEEEEEDDDDEDDDDDDAVVVVWDLIYL